MATANATRAGLLTALAGVGFTGEPTLDNAKKFVADNNIDVPGNIETIWNTKAAIALAEPAQPKEIGAKGAVVSAINAEISGDAENKRTDTKGWTPAMSRKQWERKHYDRDASAGKTVFSSSEEAELFGAKARLWILSGREYAAKSSDMDIVGKSMASNSATAGGALTFDEFDPTLIRLVEQYGAHRQVHPPMPMSSDTVYAPKETAGPTIYYPGQGNAVTESAPTLQQVSATAKEGFALITATLSMVENSRINMSDYLATTIATAVAQDQEAKYFKGDGSATYHNFTGWGPAISAVSSNSSVVTSSSATWASIAPEHFTSILGAAPAYVLQDPNAKWVMSTGFYYTVAVKLMMALGGVTYNEFAGGPGQPRLLGFPVVFAQTLPQVIDSTSTNPWYKTHCAFGAFARGAIHGEVGGGFQLATSEQRYFEYGAVGFRARYKWALSVHAPGANGTAGPVILGKTT